MQFNKLEDLILKMKKKQDEEQQVRENYQKNLKNVIKDS